MNGELSGATDLRRPGAFIYDSRLGVAEKADSLHGNFPGYFGFYRSEVNRARRVNQTRHSRRLDVSFRLKNEVFIVKFFNRIIGLNLERQLSCFFFAWIKNLQIGKRHSGPGNSSA